MLPQASLPMPIVSLEDHNTNKNAVFETASSCIH